MKKKTKLLVLFVLFAIIGTSIIFFMKINRKEGSNNNYASVNEELININECTEEFMNNYFEKTKELNEKNNKENRVIVTSKNKMKNVYGATDVVEAPNNQYILQYNSEDEKNKALEELKKDEDIIAEENIVYTFEEYNSWGVEKTGLDYATQIANNKQLEKVTVAIVDSGCNMDLFNKSYSGKILETYNEMNSSSFMYDNFGHGTHIAGTVAESTPDNVSILPVKVSDSKTIYLDDVVNAINYITYNEKADVINMSFCTYNKATAEEVAIKAANEANIICVAAAGNDNTSNKAYPASLDTTLSISAVNSKLKKAYYSNYGSGITFAAPGDDIKSINGYMSGTSMAAPHATSAVAILKSYNKNLRIENVIELLKRYAIDLGDEGYDEYYGYGLINFNGAEFYDGSDGDEFNVFKKKSDKEETKPRIEPADEIYTPIYNYGNITNLMNAKFDVYYTEDDYSTIKLSQMEGAEISEYEPFDYTIQKVKINYNNSEMILNVDNRSAKKEGWKYKVDSNSNITITKFNYIYDDGYPTKIYIPDLLDGKKVTTIGESLFENYENLEKVFFTENIATIENKVFYGDKNLKELILLDGLEKIGSQAFGKCTSLEKVLIPESVKDINFSNGETGNNPFYDCGNITIWVHKDSEAELSAQNANIDYKSITVSAGAKKLGYKPFQTVNMDNVRALIRYSDGRAEEIIEKGLKVRYRNKNTSFRGDDTYYIVSMYNKEGLYIEKKAQVFIDKLTPEYEIPTDLEAMEGMRLSEVKLPNGFEWMNENKVIENKNGYGNVIYNAKYIPDDTVNYRIVEEIQIPIKIVTASGYAVTIPKKEYKAFEQVNEKLCQVSIQYTNSKESKEIIKEGISIRYPNGNSSFRYGDTYYIVSWYNRYGQYMEKRIDDITVTKAEPTYTIPSNLTAQEGKALSEIKLPEGFEWMDENQVVEYSENTVYKAKYVPKDIENYEIIENIEIPIKVKRNVKVEYEYNEQTNQVIAKIVSDVELKNTKPTWKLSEDKKSYTKVFNQNQKYSTTVQNINGQIYEVDVVVDQIQKTDIKIQEIYNEEENEVTIQLISNIELKNTKPTWKLSEDKKMYTKTFTSNTKYNTAVEDKWGNIINTNVEVTKIKSLEIQIDYELIKETNQVKAIIASNVKLKNTKPTWKLSEDQKTYTKIYNENSGYMTKIESINGECKDVEIKVKDIDDKGPEIILDYVYNNTDNTVIVYMKSNEEMQDTKPTWKLSEDKMTYEKVYPAEEQNYYTEVKDIYGNSTNVKIQFKYKFEDIKLGENNIKLTYLFTSNNEVNVQAISDNEFEDTKPTWNLSENKKVYSKVFYNNQNYSTKFKMVDGNEFNINIIIDYFK